MWGKINSATREAWCLLLLSVFVGAIMITSLATLASAYLIVSSGGSSLAGWALATVQVWLQPLNRLAYSSPACARRPQPPCAPAGVAGAAAAARPARLVPGLQGARHARLQRLL
jgi:hypothetical protein